MLRVKELFKSFKGKNVLKGVSLSVNKGEIKGLIGVNGAGKSTLIECVCGIKTCDAGEIFVNGINVLDKKNIDKIKYCIGYVPQLFRLFNDLTVEENLKYLCAVYKIDDKACERVIDTCHLDEHRKVLAKNLSGGYRQLLSMAGAIIHNPQFLILDEPTSSMDPLFRREFWQIVNDCKERGVTVLVVTHYMEELVECDNFACLANGKVAFEGSVSEYKKEGLLDIENLLNTYSFKDIKENQ